MKKKEQKFVADFQSRLSSVPKSRLSHVPKSVPSVPERPLYNDSAGFTNVPYSYIAHPKKYY